MHFERFCQSIFLLFSTANSTDLKMPSCVSDRSSLALRAETSLVEDPDQDSSLDNDVAYAAQAVAGTESYGDDVMAIPAARYQRTTRTTTESTALGYLASRSRSIRPVSLDDDEDRSFPPPALVGTGRHRDNGVKSSPPRHQKTTSAESTSGLSNTFGYLAVGALGAALGAGACYMLAQEDQKKRDARSNDARSDQ